MKRFLLSSLLVALAGAGGAASAMAQTGAIVFVARGIPSSGIAEPVRGFPFCLLRKSYADIRKEAVAAYPMPDMVAFINKLDVSPELKAWMKKNKRVNLTGEDFLHMIKPPDVIAVPEFYKAYMDHNADDQSLSNFPKPKYKPSDAKKHPDKFAKLQDDYHEAIQHYVADNPQTLDGMDAELTSVDPGPKWRDLEAKRIPQIERYALDMAQSKYLVARTVTDLQGRGEFTGIAPGTYWLSSLKVRATVGDAWLHWDVPVQVRSGQTTNADLSNVNSTNPVAQNP
ncbi:MAG TPA: carboxypeptidase-like regulatory domain-containing protein [Verrucomicrobiae bacterium]|nr:carboxypeptidase-like regulatory domain-containing protein [Verrucomicrobiae bacterium]